MKTRQTAIGKAWFFILIPLVVLVVFGSQYRALMTQERLTITTVPTIEETRLSPTVTSPQSTRTPIPETKTPEVFSRLETPSPTATPAPDLIRAHLSYYWPPFGDINCDTECEHIATGEDWHLWVGKGVACPPEYPLGTIFVVMGDEWKCIDRGEAIVVNSDGSIWLDFLNLGMPYPIAWGSVRTVEVKRVK